MTITLDDLKTCKIKQTAHMTGSGWFGYLQECVEHPRLSRLDRYEKKDRSVTSTWRVDGLPVADLAAAAEALNIPPNLTLAEKAALDLIPVDFTDAHRVRREIEEAFPEGEVFHWLRQKGMIEYGRSPDRSDGQPWADSVPQHLRYSPILRRRP